MMDKAYDQSNILCYVISLSTAELAISVLGPNKISMKVEQDGDFHIRLRAPDLYDLS